MIWNFDNKIGIYGENKMKTFAGGKRKYWFYDTAITERADRLEVKERESKIKGTWIDEFQIPPQFFWSPNKSKEIVSWLCHVTNLVFVI